MPYSLITDLVNRIERESKCVKGLDICVWNQTTGWLHSITGIELISGSRIVNLVIRDGGLIYNADEVIKQLKAVLAGNKRNLITIYDKSNNSNLQIDNVLIDLRTGTIYLSIKGLKS